MNRADTPTLSEADLEHVQGGFPADPHSTVPEDERGKPLFPGYRIPENKLPKPFIKPVPGQQTPPIYVLPVA